VSERSLFSSTYPVTSHVDHVGPGSTFVAIRGFECDGSLFVGEAIERGATTVVLSKDHENIHFLQKVRFIFVDDCRKALAELSSAALGRPSKKLKIVGITGTKGKTSTAFLIEHILKASGFKTALIGSVKNKLLDRAVESRLTTPGSDYLQMFFAEAVKAGVEYVVMEVSSHALSLHRVHGVSFAAVGFTNLAPEHMDFYPTLTEYFLAKSKIFEQVKKGGTIVVNSDDSWGKKIVESGQSAREVVSFGLNGGDVSFRIEQENFDGIKISVDGLRLSVPSLFGSFNAYNIVMAYLIASRLGVDDASIASSLKKFRGVPGRLQMHTMKNGAVAFVDYAHNPSSFEAVLRVLRKKTKHLVVLFGCGGDRDKTKRPVMGKIASTYADRLVITNDNPRGEDPEKIIDEIFDGVLSDKKVLATKVSDRKEAIKVATGQSQEGSIVALLGKGHENYYLEKDKKDYFDDFKEVSIY